MVRQISTDDLILANETQLVYENTSGFEPVRGNLRHWKGNVGIIAGTDIPIFANIYIQDGFPDIPPFVDITPKVNHPNVEEDGTLSLKILAEWNNSNHVFQVINGIKNLFAKVPAKPYKTKKQKIAPQYAGLPKHAIPIRQIPQASATPQVAVREKDSERQQVEDSIISYQKEIEEVTKKIEKERESLLKDEGVALTSAKEISISREQDLQAEVNALDDTLEVLQEKFDDGDITNVDFLKLYRRYTKKSYKARKQLNLIKTGSGESMSREGEKSLDLEGDLYAAIVTLDNLIRSYENSEIEQIAYRKQLRALIRNIFKTRMRLEKIGFKLEEFVKREDLERKYPKGIQQLKVAEGVETADAISIPFDTLKKMPSKTADFVAAAIELIDLTRLRSVARSDLLLADIDELLHITQNFPSIPKDHWIIGDLTNWRDIIAKYKPQEIVKEDDCEKLEFQAARWLNEFRRILKEL
ncbi:MAG: ubiquitin-conjugating enzyme E2 [Candidatus Heimdallarchaeaceae archaeon]